MTTKTKEANRILSAVRVTARDLRAAAIISKHRMQDYEALCLGSLAGRTVSARLDLTELGLPPEQLHEMTISEALAEQRKKG